MKVVLLQDVKALGKKGEVVEVKEGYAKNMLLPKKLGIEATPKALNDLKLQKANACGTDPGRKIDLKRCSCKAQQQIDPGEHQRRIKDRQFLTQNNTPLVLPYADKGASRT